MKLVKDVYEENSRSVLRVDYIAVPRATHCYRCLG